MLELKFIHDAIPSESSISLELKTQRYYDQIKYVDQSAATEVKLGFIQSSPYAINELLYVENHTDKSNRWKLRNVRSFESTTVELTNTNYVFSDIKKGHTIYWYCTELEEEPSSVSIMRETRRGTEPFYDFLVEGTRIYYNAANTFNITTDNYQIYHLTYNSSSGIVTKLLEAHPVIREISWDDIDETGAILPDRKRYLINQISDRYEYTFYNCDTRIFTRSGNEKLSFDLKGTSTEESIYLKVKLSEFSTSVDGNTYNYLLPEYVPNSEVYDSSLSYKRVTKNIIKVEGGALVQDETKPITLALYDRSNTLLRTDSNVGANALDKIDYKDGFIILPYAIEQDQILAIGGYQYQNNYVYGNLDLNPIFNSDFLSGSSYLFYWKPNQTERAIHWVLFSGGGIVSCSDPDYALTISGSFNIATIIGYSKEEAMQELFNAGSASSQQWQPIAEIHNIRDTSSATYYNLMEKRLLKEDFDFSSYHFIALTDILDARGIELPINKTIVINTNYGLLAGTTFEEIKEILSNYLPPGTLVLEQNIDDPVIDSYEDDGSNATWILSLNSLTSYEVLQDNGSGFTTIDTISGSNSYELIIESSAATTQNTYKIVAVYGSESYDTNFILTIMGS